MALEAGTHLGPYEIVDPIGAGGMGEVYRARDARLGRDVAVKVIPRSVASDPERVRRFEQEARATGALHHPNILAIHDIGEHEGMPYIVSELLEGETLRGRMGGSALSVRRVIEWGVQIARGLAAAHEKGIVHRDLKPENVFVTADGHVKILDFGLAKLTQPDPDGSAFSALPTTPEKTAPGTVMGTLGYMSPEQVRGKPADSRADIFALGVILYEMLSGRHAFRGDSAADTMSAILREDPPDLADTNRNVSPALERVVRHCLEKNPEERFQSARDIAFHLESVSGASSTTMPAASDLPGPPLNRSRERLIWSVVSLICLAAGVAAGVLALRRVEAPPTAVRFTIDPLPGQTLRLTHTAVSPDGRMIVFSSTEHGGVSKLFIRAIDSLDARPLVGTEGAEYPFWSPDSRFIGFGQNRKLRKIAVGGGPPVTLCDATIFRGGAWGPDGTILFAATTLSPILRVPATGGVPTPVTRLDPEKKIISHRWPQFLPDGHRFLFMAWTPREDGREIWTATLEGGEAASLFKATSHAPFAPPGRLLYLSERTLMARPFDPQRAILNGEPVPVAEKVFAEPSNGSLSVSASNDGTLVFGTGDLPESRLEWIDRAGKSLGTVGLPGGYASLDLSPDGLRAAAQMVDRVSGTSDLWLIDLQRKTASRLTFDPASEQVPRWSPDGRTIAYASNSSGLNAIVTKTLGASHEETPLGATENNRWPAGWSPDGRVLLYQEFDPNSQANIWAETPGGKSERIPIAASEFFENQPEFSPDGRWVAYRSDETGKPEIYVQPFPPTGAKWQISIDGGGWPRWRRDGKELFFMMDDSLMAVDVEVGPSGLTIGTPRALFQEQFAVGVTAFGRSYCVAADGQRFLAMVNVEGGQARTITVTTHWQSLLGK